MYVYNLYIYIYIYIYYIYGANSKINKGVDVMQFKISYVGYIYLKRGHGSPQSLKIWRLDFGPITACLIHRVTTRTYVHISSWH